MVAVENRMDQSLAAILFTVAVVGNFVVITAGVACTLAVSFYRGCVAAIRRQDAARRNVAAFHHPDPVKTSLFESLFMAGAAALVLIGLPVALAATFHFLLPLLGHASSR
jgi:hypothetical protein